MSTLIAVFITIGLIALGVVIVCLIQKPTKEGPSLAGPNITVLNRDDTISLSMLLRNANLFPNINEACQSCKKGVLVNGKELYFPGTTLPVPGLYRVKLPGQDTIKINVVQGNYYTQKVEEKNR